MIRKHSRATSPTPAHHFVALAEHPPQLRVPPDLAGRFGYDSQRRGLTFQGWMCKATFDRLRALSSDYHYQRALEQLFQIAVPEDDTPSHRGFGLWVGAGIMLLAALALCGLFMLHH
jgi:hypothetical protein